MFIHQFLKALYVVLLAFWAYDLIRKRKKKSICYSQSISDANARERYQWRYVRWMFRAVQFFSTVYIVWTVIRFILS